MKAQVSLEYVMTWGWALLIIAGAVSIFYSFDLLNFNQYFSDSCDFYGQFTCLESTVDIYDTVNNLANVQLILYNDIGADIVLYNMSMNAPDILCDTTQSDVGWDRNAELAINVTNCDGDVIYEGARLDGEITFWFYRNYSHCYPAPVENCLFRGKGVIRQTMYT